MNDFTTATVGPGESIDQCMVDFCNHIKLEVIPKNHAITWDYLRVEFWPDSGRMIVFPALGSKSARIEKAGCQVIFADLLAEYERLGGSDLGDESFEIALLQILNKWIEIFLDGARRVSLVGHRIQFFDSDDEPPICDVQI